MTVRVKNEIVNSYWKPIITVKEQQVHQNGFPEISSTLNTYFGTGNTSVSGDEITIDIKLDNQINTPESFSNGNIIRFKLQNGNSTYNSIKLKFVDISSLEVVLKRPTNVATFPDNSLLPYINYLATYTTGTPDYFQITESEGYFTNLLENNYVQLQKTIDAVIEYASKYTGRTITDRDYIYSLSDLVDEDGNYFTITLPKNDVYNLEKITYINTSDVETEIDLDTFCIEEDGGFNEKLTITPSALLDFELPDDVSETETYPYKVYYSAGYQNNQIPEALRHAMKNHCAFLWGNRGDMVNYAEIKEYKTLDKCDAAKNLYNKYKYIGV